jgi:hypothetical protein
MYGAQKCVLFIYIELFSGTSNPCNETDVAVSACPKGKNVGLGSSCLTEKTGAL